MALHARTVAGEEARAGTRSLLALSLGVGGMAAAASALIGDPLMIIGIPAVALAAALVRGRTSLAGYLAAAVWLTLLPRMEGEAFLVPVTMISLCLVVALGRDRVAGWLTRTEAPGAADRGWIEER